jgi:hypothetical protein
MSIAAVWQDPFPGDVGPVEASHRRIFAMRAELSRNISFLLFVLALLFLGAVAGMLAAAANVAPANHVRDAFRAGAALYEKRTRAHEQYSTDLWSKARGPERGVTVHDPERVQPGLTLYSSGHAPTAILMDLEGNVVHEWQQLYSEIWDETAAPRNPVPDTQTYFRKAHVFPNGDLLAIYDGVGDSPYGYGMIKLDKDSQLIWKNLDHFHHSFSIGPDGRIYGLTHDFRFDEPVTEEGYTVDHFPRPFMDDRLVVLSPDGEVLQSVSLMDAVNRSAFRRLLWRVPAYSLEDPLHTNDVDVLDEESAAWLAQKVPEARAGQVLLSFRELATGSLALLDLEKEKIVWALQGQWMSHHDPDILPNGNILLFDNRGHFGPGGQSRILEIDPATAGIVWSYTGDEDNPFDSPIRAEQEMLANGNILITEATPGRLLEINRRGEILWEFINPVRGGPDDELIPTVSWAQRIDPGSYFRGDFRAEVLGGSNASKVELK